MTGLRGRIYTFYKEVQTLSGKEENFPLIDEDIYKTAIRLVFRKAGFRAEMMADQEVRALVDEYGKKFMGSISLTLESGVIPEAMASRLEEDIFLFSGFKTYQGLKEASRLLRDENGQVKPFDRFYNDITAIKEDYNKHWLKAEYIFATQSAQMAAKWKDFEEDADRYNLQYRTANDGKVRPEHKVLHNITLPFSDPFWDEFFPPNGWRCRCTVVQVRKGKYPGSDSGTSIQQGREATYQTGKNGMNKAAIFRFNPGKQQVIFPPHHPYYDVSESLREKLKRVLLPDVKDERGLTKKIVSVAKDDWFVRPLEKIVVETNPRNNGSTNMNGWIKLRPEIMQDCIDAVNNIKNGKENSYDQERSMATLWHEITHNRNIPGLTMKITPRQIKAMETANEFVARNTLPEFFESLGGTLKHVKLMDNRENTGYNSWVVSYQKIIDDYNLNKKTVVLLVKDYLFNESYDKQIDGLVNAIYSAGNGKITKKEAKQLVSQIY